MPNGWTALKFLGRLGCKVLAIGIPDAEIRLHAKDKAVGL